MGMKLPADMKKRIMSDPNATIGGACGVMAVTMRAAGPNVLVLPCQPPTLNELMRGHIRTRIRLGKAFREVVAHRWLGPDATGKRRVTIRIILGPRQRGADPDAYFKSVGDSLVKCGALKSDTRHGVEWGPVEYEKGKERGTVIELEDIESA